MAETYWLQGSVSANSYVQITPPAGKAYIIGPGTTIMADSLRLANSAKMANPLYTFLTSPNGGYDKPFFVVSNGGLWDQDAPAYPIWRDLSVGQAGNMNAAPELFIVNQSAGSGNYLLTGPVSTLAEEGIVDSVSMGINGSINVGWRTETVMPPGYCYLVSGVFVGLSGDTVRLVTVDNQIVADCTKLGHRFWLWSEMALKLQVNIGSTDYGGGLRVVRYREDATLYEYVNRISYIQMVSAGAYVDLVPPPGETWYVDMHNWGAAQTGYLLRNGVTQVVLWANATAFQLTSDNWMRFKNNSASSLRLFITGTKITD